MDRRNEYFTSYNRLLDSTPCPSPNRFQEMKKINDPVQIRWIQAKVSKEKQVYKLCIEWMEQLDRISSGCKIALCKKGYGELLILRSYHDGWLTSDQFPCCADKWVKQSLPITEASA